MAKGPTEQFPDFPFPSVILDTLIKEKVSSYTGNYVPQEPGTPFAGNQQTHSVADAQSYAGTISLGQRIAGDQDNEWFERYWATQPHTQDLYNYEQDNVSDISGFPVFIRRYLELRDQFPILQRPSLTPLTGLYAIRIVNPGLGYDPANPPNVTVNNGATAISVVNPADGSIAKITLKAEGANCTTAVTIDAPPAGGTQATAVGVLQPATCLLVSEKAVPSPDPWGALYLLVTRKYQTLPGPIITEFSVMGSTGIPILISRQEVAANALFQDGEFLPAAITITAIGLGVSPTVTLASDHGLPAGAYVTFATTNSTPPLGTTPLRIVSVSATNQVTVTPASPVTIIGTTGTMQSTNWITREIQPTDNGNVKMKVESIVAAPDVSVYNEDIEVSEQYPFPNFLKAINLYADTASAMQSGTSGASTSASWGGAIGLPMQAGYRGPCDGSRQRRYYFVGPPPDSFTSQFKSTIIIPSIGTFSIKGGSFSHSASVTGGAANAQSNNYRTGVIGACLTGPSPHVTGSAPTINITDVLISGGGSPTVPRIDVESAHGMVGSAFVLIVGSTSTPSINGIWQVIAVPTATSFQIQPPIPLTAGSGAAGNIQVLTTSGALGAGIATVTLDLPESIPPKIIGTLAVLAIGTGALPIITLTSDHYLRAGQIIQLTGTNCSPSLNGFWQITTVPASNQITVTPPASITGSGNAGTLQNYIMVIGQPSKLNTAALWQWYIRLIKVPYTSGGAPP